MLTNHRTTIKQYEQPNEKSFASDGWWWLLMLFVSFRFDCAPLRFSLQRNLECFSKHTMRANAVSCMNVRNPKQVRLHDS